MIPSAFYRQHEMALTERRRLILREILSNPIREDVLPRSDDDGPPLSRLLQVGEGDAVLYGRLGDLDPVLDVVYQVADPPVEPIALLIRSVITAAVRAVMGLVVSVGLVVVVPAAGAEVALLENLRGVNLAVV